MSYASPFERWAVKSVSLSRVAKATGGSLSGPGDLEISRVSTDTRTLRGGELFFALEGPTFDGHRFIGEAKKAGAAAAVVEEGNPRVDGFRPAETGFPLVIVRNSLRALGDLAAYVRQGLDVEVIGITGSTGKTCTKDFLVSILRGQTRVASSPGSYNNEIGSPLTVFSVEPGDRLLVAEMGARHKGDISRLAQILRPRIGIVTNVGMTHLQVFRSVEEIARAKAELVQSLPPDGTLFLNAGDDWSKWMSGQTRARVLKFGISRGATYRASRVRIDAGGRPSFVLHGPGFSEEVTLGVMGRHQVENALAAAACARELGVEPHLIAKGLGEARISGWRMEALESPAGFTVINDAYNASPTSTKAALDTLSILTRDRRGIAVLGGMAELGRGSRGFHEEIGRMLCGSGVDILVAVGRRARDYATAAQQHGLPRGSVFRCDDAGAALEILRAIVEPGDVILVKASRVVGLEGVAERLAEPGFLEAGAVANV